MQQDLKKENIKSVFFIMIASLACSAVIQINVSSSMQLIDYAYAGGGGSNALSSFSHARQSAASRHKTKTGVHALQK